MKKVLLTSLLAVSCVLGMVNTGLSQNCVGMIRKATVVAAMREFGYSSPLNTKAVKDFRKRYTATDDEKWFDYRNGYAAVFMTDDVRFRVEYDNKGNWSGTEKDYREKKLDRDIRKLVKQTFFDYEIAYVKEFNVPGMPEVPVYIITIEDEHSFKTLCVCQDEIRITEEYSKNS